jgi:hypothetical protein
MGWQTIVATIFQAGNRVVINPSGFFIYNGPPTFGNLVMSFTNAAGTDPFGNPYGQNLKIYGTANSSVQILAGTPAQIRLGTGDAQEATPGLFATLIDGTGTIRALASQLQAPRFTGETAGALIKLESSSEDLTTTLPTIITEAFDSGADNIQQLIDPFNYSVRKNTSLNALEFDSANNRFVIGYPIFGTATAGSVTPENWHPMALGNSWANNAGFAAASYRKVASPPNSVEVQGALSATAATSGIFFQLPSGYRPTNAQGFPCGSSGGAIAGSAPNIRCDTSGNLSVNNSTVPSASTFFFHGFISLDA